MQCWRLSRCSSSRLEDSPLRSCWKSCHRSPNAALHNAAIKQTLTIAVLSENISWHAFQAEASGHGRVSIDRLSAACCREPIFESTRALAFLPVIWRGSANRGICPADKFRAASSSCPRPLPVCFTNGTLCNAAKDELPVRLRDGTSFMSHVRTSLAVTILACQPLPHDAAQDEKRAKRGAGHENKSRQTQEQVPARLRFLCTRRHRCGGWLRADFPGRSSC